MVYDIVLKGHLSERLLSNFHLTQLELLAEGFTKITCDVPDQAALHGLLTRFRDLNMDIIELKERTPHRG